MDAIEIMLKEYETLRQEVLAAMSNRNSILSFGLATIGAIFTASIAADMVANVLSLELPKTVDQLPQFRRDHVDLLHLPRRPRVRTMARVLHLP